MTDQTASRGLAWPSVANILTIVGILAALAYFLGKQYTDAYYSTFGIPSSAVRLSPSEYMFESKHFVVFLVFMLVFAIFWFTPSPSEHAAAKSPPPGQSPLLAGIAKPLVRIGKLLTGYFPDWHLPERWAWTHHVALKIHILGVPFLLLTFIFADVLPWWVGFSIIAGYMSFMFLAAFGNRAIFVLLAPTVLFFGIVAFLYTVPSSLAERDANRIMDDPGRLTQVEIFWDEGVAGLMPLPVDGSGTSNARMLLETADTFYLLVEQEDGIDVVGIPSTSVNAIRYVGDSD